MLEWKKQTGNDVLFETTIDKTKFTFMLDTTKVIRERGTETDNETLKTDKNKPESIEKTDKKNEKTVEKKMETVEKTAEKMLTLMTENPNITTFQLSDTINISISAINQQIAKLKNKGFIRRESADKGGKWIIIKTD